MKKIKILLKWGVSAAAFVALFMFLNVYNVEAQQGMNHHKKPQGKCRGSAANCAVWNVV